MFSLRKIKELKGYRFFQDYKWDENTCKLFEKNNLIYGWNGSGKTTICDFFKNLEDGAIPIDEATCVLMFEDSSSGQMKSITQANLGSLPYAFKVFHQNYIQENISKDNVKHIFTVGKEQADKLAEAKRLRAIAVQQSATVKKSSGEYAGLLQEIDRFKTAKAKSIKDAANYTNAFKSCEEIPKAHIGIVWYKGMCYCKKLVPQNNGLLLVSLNKGYSPIPVESFDEYHLFGEVVEIIPAK